MHGSKAEVPETFQIPEATWREAEWGDMHVSFETYHEDFDVSPFLKGLQDDMCQCPHWGYVISGRLRVRYLDREEEINAGEAYYLPPGHTIMLAKGTELVEFSPIDKFREHMRSVEANLQKSQEEATGQNEGARIR